MFCEQHWNDTLKYVLKHGMGEALPKTSEELKQLHSSFDFSKSIRTKELFEPVTILHYRIGQQLQEENTAKLIETDDSVPNNGCGVCLLDHIVSDHLSRCRSGLCPVTIIYGELGFLESEIAALSSIYSTLKNYGTATQIVIH